MNTVEFLRHVLPSQGYYVSIVINDGNGPRQGFFDNIDTLANAVSKLSASGNNVYYAVSSFADKRRGRKQDNVAYTRALYIDVDCGPEKPFADWREGLRALGEFVQQHNLPKPMTISSGNGLHVYWVFDTDLDPAAWQPLADALKRIMPATFDRSVPADSARVLRATGTVNPKGGREVKLLIAAPTVTVDQMRSALQVSDPAPRIVQHTSSPLSASLAVNQEYPPANPDVITSKCAQVRWATDNQADVMEPMWYALMGIAAHCTDPRGTAIAWSKDHPAYDEDKTVRKVMQWHKATTGPTTCARLEQERPDGCKGCRFKDRIGTPARLGLQYEEANVAADAPDETAAIIPLPKQFKRTATGIKMVVDGTDIDICKFDVYPVGYGRDETLGYETVRYRWKRPHVGWQPLAFRQSYLTDTNSREFAQAVADQGIVIGNKKQTEQFQIMLRTYMDELRQLRSMTNLYATMGWKDEHTQFLLGEALFKRHPDGSVTEESVNIATHTSRVATDMYTTSGTADEWAAFTSLLEKAHMPIHMFALMVSMSAPLYSFTGLRGITVNLYGPTGSGKTLAQYFQQSIWGDPTQLHYSAKFTQNALYARMGLYNNLPMTIDETTMLPAKEVGDFLYSVSQGQEKARLTKGAEERDRKTWATVVTTSANKSMSTSLVASGMETDAQIMRLLEITMTPHPLFTRNTKAGQQIYEFVTSHYGAVGRVLARHLTELGPTGIRAMIAHHKEQFFKQYNAQFSGNERFWEQCIVLADLMGKLATDLGLIQFDYTKGTTAVLMQIGAMRRAVAENATDAFDIITEYLNDNADAAVTVMHTGSNKPTPDFSRHLPHGELRIRFDVHRSTPVASFDRGTVLLDRKHFKTWLAMRGADYRTIMKEIAEQGVDATPKTGKAYLGKDTPIKLGQQYVVGVNLSHPRLVGILTDMDDAMVQAALGGLSVVQGGRP
jgi:DNA primase